MDLIEEFISTLVKKEITTKNIKVLEDGDVGSYFQYLESNNCFLSLLKIVI